MKRRVKKILALSLALALLSALWGCGNDDFQSRGAAGTEASASPTGAGTLSNTGSTAQRAPESLPGDTPIDSAGLPEQLATERWKVCKVDGSGFLGFALREDGTEGELCSVSLTNLDETAGKLAPGAVVELAYDGMVLETWPGQIPGVSSVTVVEQGEDFMTLYLDVLEYIYNEDTGLNPKGSAEVPVTYGFDITGVQNLTEGEKEALAYLFTCAHDTDWEAGEMPADFVLGTYEELVKNGYIDGENLYWEDGVLFTIEDEPAQDGVFTFSMEKWRGGLGAIGWEECTAKKDNDGWIFEPSGTMWIS